MDIDVVMVEFKRNLQGRGYAERSVETYIDVLKSFKGFVQERNLTDLRKVTHESILDYKEHLMALPISMETVAQKIRSVKRMFEYLVDSHRLLINPTEGIVETCRRNKKPGPVLSVEQMKSLLAQPNLSLPLEIRDKAIMELLYSTAIRRNELLSLQVYDVDLKDKVLYIRKGKGGSQRVVPLGKSAVVYLKEYLEKIRSRYAKNNPQERHLFLTRTGAAVTQEMVSALLAKYCKRAGLNKSAHPHMIRRTCATHMLQQGVDIRYIQKLLGHKHIKTTQGYTKIRPIERKRIHDKTHPGKRLGRKNKKP